jgi:HSP20 family molecular chaperone IbpA
VILGHKGDDTMTYLDKTIIDVFFKDFLNGEDLIFKDIQNVPKIKHPIDILTDENGIFFEIAAVGVEKKDLDISVDGDVFRVEYRKPEKKEKDLVYSGIKKSSFNVAFKVNPKFNMELLKAELDKGILTVFIPLSENKKTRRVEIE